MTDTQKHLILKDDNDRVKLYTVDNVYLGDIHISKYDIVNNHIVLFTNDSDYGDTAIAFFPVSTTKFIKHR